MKSDEALPNPPGFFMLPDMMVIGDPPAKLAKALAVIADALHDELTWQRGPKIASLDKTKESCVLTSATVREFLFRIGFHDVEMRPCFFMARAFRDEQELHSMGIGHDELSPRDPKRPGYWRGHMVAVAAGYLIDTTLYRIATRPAFAGLPGMFAVPLLDPDDVGEVRIRNLRPLAIERMQQPTDETLIADLAWLDQPHNRSWRDGPDYRHRDWRLAVAARLVERFGQWRD